MAIAATPFVPRDFQVPARLETTDFTLRTLTVDDVVKDYDAVITSVAHLQAIWPGGTWPQGLTLRQNLVDLGWHEKEFHLRQSFAYTVVSPSEDRVLGCVYINPSQKAGHDAVVYLWARQSELAAGLEDRLYAAVKAWLQTSWPFESAAFPGRDTSWEDWNTKPPQLR